MNDKNKIIVNLVGTSDQLFAIRVVVNLVLTITIVLHELKNDSYLELLL